MDLQLAQLFAELGFKYDRSQLNQFKKDLQDLANRAKSSTHRISTDISSVGGAASRSSIHVDSFVKKIRSSYSRVKPSLEKMRKDLAKINRALDSGNLDAHQTRSYSDLHERVLASIQREERRRLTSTQRAAEATRRAQEAEARRDRALARARERDADRLARGREREVRQRLRSVLERRRLEERAERERHQQAVRDIRIEGRLANTEARKYRRGLYAVGGALGALGGIYSLKESTHQYQNYQGALAGLTAATGSEEKANTDFKWLQQLSDRLGIFAGNTTRGYTSLAANTKNAGIDDKTTKDVFEGVLSYGRVLNLSKDDTDGVLKALSQMVGKGKLNAEEVRQQAGERLPGFIPAAARALGFGDGEKGTAKFFQELQGGKLTAKMLFPNLAKELMTMANSGDALTKAMNTTSAAIGRLQTNLWMANKTFNEAGFDKSVRNIANTMSESAKKMDLVWKALGKATTVIGTALETPIEIIGTLSESIQGLFANNPQLKTQAKIFAGIVTAAFAPLRKLFALLWVVPAGISAMNDLIEKWKSGDIGKKSWKELGVEVGLAAASLAIIATTVYKMVNGIIKASRIARGLGNSLGGVNQAGNATGGGGAFGRGQRNPTPTNPNNTGRPRYGESANQGSGRNGNSRFGNAGKVVGTGATAALVVGSSLIPEKPDDGTKNSAVDYAQKTVTSGTQGALMGSWFGPYGSLIGGAIGTGWGAGRAYGEDAGNAVGDQMDAVANIALLAQKLYSNKDNMSLNLEGPLKELQDKYGKLTSNILSAGRSDHLIDDTRNFLQNPHSLIQDPKNAQMMQPSTNIGTQYNGPKIEKIEFNISGGDQNEIRSTIDDVLMGHIRTASSSTPMTEY